jgi:hypothetical protein
MSRCCISCFALGPAPRSNPCLGGIPRSCSLPGRHCIRSGVLRGLPKEGDAVGHFFPLQLHAGAIEVVGGVALFVDDCGPPGMADHFGPDYFFLCELAGLVGGELDGGFLASAGLVVVWTCSGGASG